MVFLETASIAAIDSVYDAVCQMLSELKEHDKAEIPISNHLTAYDGVTVTVAVSHDPMLIGCRVVSDVPRGLMSSKLLRMTPKAFKEADHFVYCKLFLQTITRAVYVCGSNRTLNISRGAVPGGPEVHYGVEFRHPNEYRFSISSGDVYAVVTISDSEYSNR